MDIKSSKGSTTLAISATPSLLSIASQFDLPPIVHHRDQHRRGSFAPYEWVSAKSKPHALIVSRKPPPLVGSGSGAMTDVSGLTRYGVYRPPRAVLIGRPPDKELESAGGQFYSKPSETGKDKPHAILFSRRKDQLVGSGAGQFENVFGMTRYGRANPPRPIILSRHPPKEKIDPGPGATALIEPPSRRIGITLKGWPEPLPEECMEPSPGFYTLPPLGKGPAVSLKSRHYADGQEQSPGPIYDTHDMIDTRKGISMTFKPFPAHEGDILPGPSHYGTLPGDEAVKQTLLNFPSVKFAGKNFHPDSRFTKDTSSTPGPGPGAFNVADIGKSRGRGALITSRLKVPFESCGSNRLENLFGKSRFGLGSNKGAVIVGRHAHGKRCKSEEPGDGGWGPGSGYGKRPDKRVGITLKSRIPEIGSKREPGPGPGSYNLPVFFGKGPAYSIIRRHFQEGIFGDERVPPCRKRDPPKKCDEEAETESCNRRQLDQIDSCIQLVEAKGKNGKDWDRSSLIPFLESLATTS